MQIPAARNTGVSYSSVNQPDGASEADQQWQQGEQWLQQQINEVALLCSALNPPQAACPVDDEQPPAPPARESKEAPSEVLLVCDGG